MNKSNVSLCAINISGTSVAEFTVFVNNNSRKENLSLEILELLEMFQI